MTRDKQATDRLNSKLDDGRVAITLLASKKIPDVSSAILPEREQNDRLNSSNSKPPRLSIVIQIVGSRGKW